MTIYVSIVSRMALITSSVALLLLLMAQLATAQPNFVDCKNPRGPTAVLTRENEFVVFHGPHATFVKKEFHHSLPVVREDTKRNYLGQKDVDAAWMINGKTFATNDRVVCSYNGNGIPDSCRRGSDPSFWFPDLKEKSGINLDGFYSGTNVGQETVLIFRRTYDNSSDRDPIIAVIDNKKLTTRKEIKYPKGSNDDNAPSAMGFLGGSGDGTYSIYVFFDHVYGLYQVPKDLSRPILADQSVLFRTAKTWYGCSPELCLEADFDAAVYVNETHQMIRGRHLWEFQKFNKRMVATETKKVADLYKVNQDIDAGFAFDKFLYLFVTGKEVYVFDLDKKKSTKKAVSDVFVGFKGQVDAAFVWDTNIFLIEGDTVTKFMPKTHDRFELDRATVAMTSHWTQLPNNVDSATLVRDENNVKKVMFTKGNFYYLGNQPKEGTRAMVTSEMSQGYLFKCLDETYQKLRGSLISINSYAQFVNYIRKFRPKEMDPGPEPPTTPGPVTPSTQPTKSSEAPSSTKPTTNTATRASTTTPTPTTTESITTPAAGQQQASSKSIVLPLLIALIAFLALAAAAIIFFVRRKKKIAGTDEKKDRYLKTDRKEAELGKELANSSTVDTIDSNGSAPKKKGKKKLDLSKGAARSLSAFPKTRVKVIDYSSSINQIP